MRLVFISSERWDATFRGYSPSESETNTLTDNLITR